MDGAVKMKQGYLLFHVNICFPVLAKKTIKKLLKNVTGRSCRSANGRIFQLMLSCLRSHMTL